MWRHWVRAIIHHGMGHRAASNEKLRELLETGAAGAPFQIEEVYGARGDADAAFEWLERARAARDTGLTEVEVNPWLRSFHGALRWGAFLKKMGFAN